MGQLLQLEDFARAETLHAPQHDPSEALATEKRGYDKGYHAGWEDAVNEARSSDQKALADASAALQQIDFTYFEARQHILNSFKPLLEAIMAAVLPATAQHALVPLVEEELEKLTTTLQAPIDIYCSPETAPYVSEQIKEQSKTPITIKTEDTLTSSQVQLRYSDGMTNVDMDEAIARIKKVIENFFTGAEVEGKLHG